MGQEAVCIARFDGQIAEGRALLESSELRFRGEFRLNLPFRDVRTVTVEDGNLILAGTAGTATFELGPLAEKWAAKIRNPKELLDKLGVKPGTRVCLLERDRWDGAFLARLAERSTLDAAVEDATAVFLPVACAADLAALTGLRAAIAGDAVVWVVYPKGRLEVREAAVIAAGRQAGFTDVKVVAFSATHTAFKFVVPVAARGGSGERKPA
jgi:hypothetical protein